MADEQNSERDTSRSTSEPSAQEAQLDPTRQVNCPACGFLQPEDLFCASCGKSLRKSGTNKRAWWQNPMVWVGAAAVVGTGAWLGLSADSAKNSANSEADSSIFRNATQRAKLLKAEGDGSAQALRKTEERRERISAASTGNSESQSSLGAEAPRPQNFNSAALPADPTLAAQPTKAKSRATATTEPPVAAAASSADPLQLHLVAAQAPPEWLASVGISAPGFHRVPGLEKILRTQRQGLRVLSVHSESLSAATSAEASVPENFSLSLNGQGRIEVALYAYAPDAKQVEVVMSSAKHRSDRTPASLPPQQNVLEIDREAMDQSGWVLVSGAQDPVVLIFARSSSRKP
ncbi:MAG TPA: zinc ribbon domain-containing protein [Pseudobdellovibrionaceae bacterium]|nr:zinc ribbon domain-containing protein [Pseudobdellovibrionaceae bacterium]